MKVETQKDYQERINKVLVYINDNLDEKLELEKLAALSNFSPFHFHRIMRAHLKESLGSFVLRLRIDRAAAQLQHSRSPVSEIAYSVGYDTPSSFTKAFKKRFGVSPAEFRESMVNFKMDLDIVQFNKTEIMEELKPKIKNLKTKKVIFVQRTGKYGNSAGDAWEAVCSFAQKKKLFGFKTEFIGISHDDPEITEEEKLRYDACVTIRKDVKPEGEVGYKEIEGGQYAIFRHNGSYEKLGETYEYIYRKWLPQSGYELRNISCYENYINSPDKVKPEKLKTDIHIPIV